jgi:hypothetical protein
MLIGPKAHKGRRLLIVLGAMAFTLGATSQSCTLRELLKKDSNSDLSFSTSLRILDSGGAELDTFNQGDPIEFELKVRNRDNQSATVTFPTSQQTDFVVVKAGTDTVVWQWSKHQVAPTQTSSTLDFAADQTRTFRVDWDQTDDNGNLLDRGNYEARGVMVFDGFDNDPLKVNQFGSDPEPFTVQ